MNLSPLVPGCAFEAVAQSLENKTEFFPEAGFLWYRLTFSFYVFENSSAADLKTAGKTLYFQIFEIPASDFNFGGCNTIFVNSNNVS